MQFYRASRSLQTISLTSTSLRGSRSLQNDFGRVSLVLGTLTAPSAINSSNSLSSSSVVVRGMILAIGLLRSITRTSEPRRTASHLVYGLTTHAVFNVLRNVTS